LNFIVRSTIIVNNSLALIFEGVRDKSTSFFLVIVPFIFGPLKDCGLL